MPKILIADDEPEVVQFCTFVLEKQKHAVLSAGTGPKTMETLKQEKPDLLILDVMLPGMDGYTVQLQMAQESELANIPVVIITALKPAKGLFDKFSQVKGFLGKPFQAEELLDAVNQALNTKTPPIS